MWDSPYEMITPLPSPFIYVVKGGVGGTQEGKKRVQGHRRGRTLLGGSQRLWREGGCDVEAFWHTWPPSCHSVPGWQQCSAALRKVPSDAWHRSTLKGPESGTRQLEVTQHGDSRSCCCRYTIQSGLHGYWFKCSRYWCWSQQDRKMHDINHRLSHDHKLHSIVTLFIKSLL